MKLSAERIVEAPAERVWEVIGREYARIGEWATAVRRSRARDGGSTAAPVGGRVCETGLRALPEVEETIVAYDDAGRTLTYVGAGLPSFVGEARNRWQVVAVHQRRSRVRLDAEIEIRGIAGRLLAVPLGVWLARQGARTLEDLEHYVERGRPSRRKRRQLGDPGETP